MKLRLFILSLALMGLSATQAQIDATINPLGIIWANPTISVDFALSEDFSVEPTLGVRFSDGLFSDDDYTRFRIPITIAGKYYFSPEEGADGFYASLWLKFVNINVDFIEGSGNSDYTRNRFGMGIGAGYKVVSKGGIVFDIGAGIGRKVVETTNFADVLLVEDLLDIFDIMILSRLSIGYRFGSR